MKLYENERYCRGGIYYSRISYVKEKYGIVGMQKLLREMKKYGYTGPEDDSEIKIMEKYPVDYNIIFLKAFKNLYGEKAFERLALESPKRKGVVGTFVRWAGKPEEIVKNAGKYWNTFYLFGKLEGKMTGEKEAIVKGFDVSPDKIFCDFLTLYFKGIFILIGENNVRVEHTKCTHKGDEHEEWHIKW